MVTSQQLTMCFYAAAVDPQMLADMLSNADVTSFEGHRVRLASFLATADRVWDGELQLVDMYNEKFLLGYAFSGGQCLCDKFMTIISRHAWHVCYLHRPFMIIHRIRRQGILDIIILDITIFDIIILDIF